MKYILIIDDEETVRDFLEHYFTKMNFIVIVQPNGASALEYLMSGKPADAVITDLNMPIMSGMNFIKAVRSQKELLSLPILVLSGNDRSESKIGALRVGADDYITKPFNPEEILSRLNAIFRRIEIYKNQN